MDEDDIAMAEGGASESGAGDTDRTDPSARDPPSGGMAVYPNTIRLTGRRQALLRAHRIAQGTFTDEDYGELLAARGELDTMWTRTLAAAYLSSGQREFALEAYVDTLPSGAELHSPSADFYSISARAGRPLAPVRSPTYIVP